ncbi:chitosanase [Kutzneria sp. CA-103260]|uniref:chitosanase n=1 Tax=Kutzneria sp. CA-103260 TaxID=2802641 RepID=UPI003FA52E05
MHDGRGVTAGRAGFTTGDGDVLRVITAFTATNPGNRSRASLRSCSGWPTGTTTPRACRNRTTSPPSSTVSEPTAMLFPR